MNNAILRSLTVALAVLAAAGCNRQDDATNTPQNHPPVVSGDSTPPASQTSPGAADSATNSSSTATSSSDMPSSSSAAPAATGAGSRMADPTATPTTGSSVPGTGDTRSAGKVIDDDWITTKTKAALLAASDLKARDIKVETRRGTVTLSGSVPTSAQSERAASVARDIDGVSSVDNRIAVKP